MIGLVDGIGDVAVGIGDEEVRGAQVGRSARHDVLGSGDESADAARALEAAGEV